MMAKVTHDKLIHENVKSLAMFSRIFGYEFLIKNCDRMETAFYYSRNNFICVMYKHELDKNLIIGFNENDPDGVFAGYYKDDGSPISITGDHYVYIPFNGADNVRAVISQKVFELFNIQLDL